MLPAGWQQTPHLFARTQGFRWSPSINILAGPLGRSYPWWDDQRLSQCGQGEGQPSFKGEHLAVNAQEPTGHHSGPRNGGCNMASQQLQANRAHEGAAQVAKRRKTLAICVMLVCAAMQPATHRVFAC